MSAVGEIPRVGDQLSTLSVRPTALQLFAFSAATWNTHLIHYDADYAREREGYPDVLVQSSLYACFLSQAIRAAYGPGPVIAGLGWQNRGIAVPGDQLTVTGQVSEVTPGPDGAEVRLTLEENNQRGELCIRGWATLRFTPGDDR
jgi:hydroxyacyl-ACP dehydratase HTD2-like protein with hotdog domain